MGRQGTELGASPVTVSSGDSGQGVGCGGPPPHDRRIQVGDDAGDDTSLHSLLLHKHPSCLLRDPAVCVRHACEGGRRPPEFRRLLASLQQVLSTSACIHHIPPLPVNDRAFLTLRAFLLMRYKIRTVV